MRVSKRQPLPPPAAFALAALLVFFAALPTPALGEALPVYEPISLAGGFDPLPQTGRAPYAPSPDGYGADGLSYRDDTISVRLTEIRAYDTPVYIAYVQVADVSQLRTDQAKAHPSKAKERPDRLAKRCQAVFATNADYYIYHDFGIVYRQGKLLRNRASEDFDGLFIDANGDFHIVAPLTKAGAAEVPGPVHCSFCFGPALVIDGEIHETPDRRVTYNQRMGIAQLGPLTYMLVCCDGPKQKDSAGLSIPQFAQLMKDLGAVNAYNLDGGSSACMIFQGKKINGQNPASIRAVGEILYFATAVPDTVATEP